jgi:eukaryotic-like serine/threonine-protein kinase
MVLIDFGDSSLLDHVADEHLDPGGESIFDAQDGSSGTIGSEMYRAPSFGQAIGTVEADVFALGIILYQTVAGNFQQPLSAGWQQDVRDPLLEESTARFLALFCLPSSGPGGMSVLDAK